MPPPVAGSPDVGAVSSAAQFLAAETVVVPSGPVAVDPGCEAVIDPELLAAFPATVAPTWQTEPMAPSDGCDGTADPWWAVAAVIAGATVFPKSQRRKRPALALRAG